MSSRTPASPSSSTETAAATAATRSSLRVTTTLTKALAFASPATTLAAPAAFEGDDGSSVALPAYTVEEKANKQVSSPKFTQPLRDTPQTIVVIPNSLYNQQAATGLADVLRNTPGITFLAGEGGNVAGPNSFVMRGFDSTGNVFVDGVRDNGNYSRDIFNVEQVEVAKGPASDNGRGGAGGYVNLSTKVPQASALHAATASYGFDEVGGDPRLRATADINQPLNDRTAVRLNLLWQEGGLIGRDHAEKNLWGVAPSLAFGLGSPTRLHLAYQHTEQNDRPDQGYPGGAIPGTTTAARPALPVDRANWYGLSGDYDDVTGDVLLARVEHDVKRDLKLSNQTRYNLTDRQALYAVPGAYAAATDTVTTNRQAFAREIETLSNQTSLTTSFQTGSLGHDLATGIEFIREDGRTKRDWTGLGTVTPANVYRPDPDRAVTGFAPVYNWVDTVRIDSAAAYANDTVGLTDKLQASAGLRVERYDADIEFRRVADGAAVRYAAGDTLLTGKLGFVYKPVPAGSLYATYGVSAQPPGTSFLSNDNGSRNNGGPTDPAAPGTSITGQNAPNANPQESFNYEVGAKWDFLQGKLSTTVALFHTERKNISTSTNTDGSPASYGDQTSRGVELGVSGHLSPAWQVFGGVSYLDTENRNTASATANGADLPFTPHWTGNLWTTYRLPLGLTVGGGVRYAGESVAAGSPNATTVNRLPSYTVFDAMAAYEVNRHLTLRVNVANVTDEFYARSLNNNVQRALLGDARNFVVSAEFKF